MNIKVFEELVAAAEVAHKKLMSFPSDIVNDNDILPLTYALKAAKAELKKQGEVKVFERYAIVGNKNAKILHGKFVQFCMDEITINDEVRITYEKLDGK